MDVKEFGTFGDGRSYDSYGPLELYEADKEDADEDEDEEGDINFPVVGS